MMAPIDTKQESVRSDHRRRSSENGVKAAWSVQLVHLTNWTKSNSSNGRVGRYDQSNSPNGRMGHCGRSNSPI
ncbi:hypothetical protein F2Q69_00022656 [Brassica cretica]|uniref:Uncharacterized protein n=1 Tax=Brassica cretica TaxID=69181 RepID=A0A8S9Q576_BRACR|nr:hypothetical protein F2Q69_00022656 [Brassica cretica]